MPAELAHTLDPHDPALTVTVTAANGRVLDVVVIQALDGAFVLYLDPQPEADTADSDNPWGVAWEPTADRLRVIVAGHPAWNYPDKGTQSYGATGADLGAAP